MKLYNTTAMRVRCYILFFCTMLLIGCKARYQESLEQINLNKNWEFKNTNEALWHRAEVPGDVISEISRLRGWTDRWFLSSKQINDILNATWEYRTVFDVPETMLLKDSITLALPGLRGSADIFINNTPVTSGLFIEETCVLSVREFLKVANNTLRIVFKPYIQSVSHADSVEIEDSIVDDEAHRDLSYMLSGLDKLPFSKVKALPSLTEAPYLTAWSNAMIEDVFFYPLTISDKNAQYNAEISIMAARETEMNLEIRIDNKSIIKLYELQLKPGINKQMVSFNIPNPKLWWVNGLGQQHIYDVSFRLFSSRQLAHEVTFPLGVRKIDISFDPDSVNKPLSVQINGQPVFLKGGSIDIPVTIDPKNIESYYKRIVENANAANVNIIRVLHSDFYQPDLFYSLCSKNGILVWQDFIVSEQKNSSDLNKYKYSVERTVKSLRNMPCCAVYMGKPDVCNDVKTKLDEAQNSSGIASFIKKSFSLILKKYDHRTFYWSVADKHEKYNEVLSGKVGNPCLASSSYFESEAWRAYVSPASFKNLVHDKSIRPGTIDSFLHSSAIMDKILASNPQFAIHMLRVGKSFPNATSMGSAFYLSQLHQASKIKDLIEGYRIYGSNDLNFLKSPLYDPRPLGAGSFTDFWGYTKASYYSLKNSYAGVLLIAQREGLHVNIFAVNDEHKDLDAILLCKMIDFSGNGYFVKQVPVKIIANSKVLLLSLSKKELLTDLSTSKVALLLQLNQPGRTYVQNLFYFEEPKQLDLPKANIKVDINESSQGFNVILKSDVLAKNVFMETNKPGTRFSDNNIDILPGKRYKIVVNYEGSRNELFQDLVITSLNNLK